MAAILIVEDDKTTNDLICDYLHDARHIVYQAYDGIEALELFAKESIELVILDIMLPHINGIQVLNEIRKGSMVPVLMLTALNDERTQINSFDSMADDYITKPFSMVLLGKRVLALLRRSGKIAEKNVWEYGDIKIDFNGYLAEKGGEPVELAPKEIQLLRLLIQNAGRVMTRENLIDDVWGVDAPLFDRTIDTYIRRIRQKLNLDCITTVKGVGYRFEVLS
ncbi:MAG: response regulator transcription factor [Lachnospira sp.]|jgi:two-component system response regulator Irr|nr:response regulator transcription factor [Lachnospira sp.]